MTSKKSTTVRSLVMLFAVAERFAPPLGARLLDRTWFRLPVVPARAKQVQVALPEGEWFEVPFAQGVIRGRVYGDDGPLVYLVHGWGGWGLQLAAFVPPLVERGFRVVEYDAPSHGLSDPGREGAGRSTLLDLADAFDAVVAAVGPAYGVVAHSLGAAAMTHALKHGAELGRTVFVAAATDFTVTLDQYQRAFGFGPRVRAGFLRRFAARFGPMEDFEVVSTVSRLAATRELPPLLILHDRDDRETPVDGSEHLAKTWPDAVLELTEGLGHRRILRDPDVITRAVEHLSAS